MIYYAHMKYIRIATMALGILFATQVYALSFSVSEKVESYNNITGQTTLVVNIKAEQTDIYQLEMFFAKTQVELQNNPIRGFTYRANPLARGKTDTQKYTISNMTPGEWYVYYVDNNGEPTESRKITVSESKTLIPTTATSLTTNNAVLFEFPNDTNHIKYSADRAEFNGMVYKTTTEKIPVKFSVYIGTSTSNFTAHQSFDLTNTFQGNPPSSPWVAGFTDLKPDTTYYILVKDDINKNPDTSQIGSVYSFKTLPAGASTSSQSVTDKPSPAFTDNDGKGGLFSYVYNTQTGNPGGLNYNLSTESDQGLVPCRAEEGIESRCGFRDLMTLIGNIINFALVLILPIIAILAVVIGVMMISNRSNPTKLIELKNQATKILIGVMVILLSWVLVANILNVVLGDEAKRYILLDLASFK